MPICKYCEKEFASTAALGGHIRQKHAEQQKESGAPRASQDTHCPVCNYELLFTSCWEERGLTVCGKCGCMFDKPSKEVVSHNWAKLRAIGVLPPAG